MPIEYIIYIPIMVFVSIILMSKAKNKAFIGLFLLWLFGSPIFLNPRYVISLTFFGIDIQPNRFLFLVLTPILILWILTPRRLMIQEDSVKPTRLRAFNIAVIGYILIVVITVGLNIKSIGTRTAIAYITNSITFAVVYFVSKKFIKNDDFVLFQIAILTFAVISAILGVYQFFINPDFFRLGYIRGAFSGYYRANGLFTAEYDQGIFLILSIIVVISTNLKRWMKIVFIIIACVAVFLTMHRLSWVALIFTLGMIWLLYLRKNLFTYLFVPLILMVLALFALNVSWSQLAIGKFGRNLITNRILADTISGRLSQYKFSFYILKKYPLGIGGYSTSFYNQIAYNQGIPLGDDNVALVVHNGFLAAGVKYGILGLILFSLFIFTPILDFLKLSIREGKNWYPLLMILLVFLVFNFTNDFSFLGDQIGVALAWLIGGYLSVNHPNHVGAINIQSTIQDSLKY
jgi:O-antigen ligase